MTRWDPPVLDQAFPCGCGRCGQHRMGGGGSSRYGDLLSRHREDLRVNGEPVCPHCGSGMLYGEIPSGQCTGCLLGFDADARQAAGLREKP